MRYAYITEYLFGPPSEPIDVSAFVETTSREAHLLNTVAFPVPGQDELNNLSREELEELEKECRCVLFFYLLRSDKLPVYIVSLISRPHSKRLGMISNHV